MRVLTITNLYPPHSYGGYELSCMDVMQRFTEAGHDVTVLTSTATVPGVAASAEPHVRRELTPWWDWERQTPRVPRRARHLVAAEARNRRSLRRALRDVRPDIVSVWHMGGLSLGLLTEVERHDLPMVVVVGDDWLVYGRELDPWTRAWDRHPRLARLAERLGLPATRRPTLDRAVLAFNSHRTREHAAAAGACPGSCSVIAYPGVDTRDFPVEEPTPRPWQGRLLYVGRTDPQKGVQTLIRALALLAPETTLECVGGGNEGHRQQLAQLVANLGLGERVRFSVAGRGELAARYRAADVLVFASEWEEPFGIVPLEAMASGTPVVATGTGGSGEFLTDGRNCVLFRPGDPEDLARAIREVGADDSLRWRITLAGRDTAGELTSDRYAAQLLELHERTRT
jgi:glycosyltransferase involved in cell wall biosynthesis